MPIGGKDAFLSKVTFRRESKWYSKTKQELKDMETIEERAALNLIYEKDFCGNSLSDNMVCRAYVRGAEEQKAIDEAKLLKLKSAWEKQAQINHDDEANYQQGYHDAIDKACEWFADYLMEIGYPDDWMRDSPNMASGKERFIKAMEE